MGVLTHLDQFKQTDVMNKTKKRLKHRFWTEVVDGFVNIFQANLLLIRCKIVLSLGACKWPLS